MAVDIHVQVTDPPSCVNRIAAHLDRLASHLDRTFNRISQEVSRSSQSQERASDRVAIQQDRLLDALHQMAALKPAPAPDLSGLLKMLDRQWAGVLRALKDARTEPTDVAQMTPAVDERFDRLEEAMKRSATMTASPLLLRRFDEMTEAIRKMRPKTYGIMRG